MRSWLPVPPGAGVLERVHALDAGKLGRALMLQAAYAGVRTGTVARTASVSDGIMIDVDGAGRVLGIEVLDGSHWQAGGRCCWSCRES
jgi:uncharacterized protein YuzE